VLKRVSGRREVSSIVALVVMPDRRQVRLYARHFQGYVRGPQVAATLRYLHRKVRRPLVVVWDGLNAHRSAEVLRLTKEHPGLFFLEPLPPYAPDLNPEESCNSVVKSLLRNATPDDVEELRRMARAGFRRLQHRPDTLRAFFDRAHLRL
jgi:transposase